MVRRFDYRLEIVRNGVCFDVLRAVDSPSIIGDSEANIKMSMRATVLPNDNMDVMTDKIRPIAEIDGVDYPFGLYNIARLERQTDEAGSTVWELEAYDQSWVLNQTRLETIYKLTQGANCVNAVVALLTNAGVQSRSVPSSQTMPYDIEWQIGTSILTVVNDILTAINYDALYFDSRGYAVVQPYKEPTADNIDLTIDGDSELSVVGVSNSQTTDIFDAPNVFIVTCSPPDLETPLRATAVNNSAVSAKSTVRRGRRIAQVSSVDNISSAAALQEHADKLKLESMLSTDELTITTAILPNIVINQIIAITHPDVGGIYREKRWSAQLSTDGQMEHTLQRMVLV